MGEYTKPPYKKLNRLTGKWELITPKPIEFTKERGEFLGVRIDIVKDEYERERNKKKNGKNKRKD